MADRTDGGSMVVTALASDTVARIPPAASIRELAEVLVSSGVGALVVGDGDTVDGVVSERDLVRGLASGDDVAGMRAIDLASTTVVWCDVTATVAEVAQQMMDHYVRHVLLEDDGRLAGIVSARDLLGAYVSSDPGLGSDDNW